MMSRERREELREAAEFTLRQEKILRQKDLLLSMRPFELLSLLDSIEEQEAELERRLAKNVRYSERLALAEKLARAAEKFPFVDVAEVEELRALLAEWRKEG